MILVMAKEPRPGQSKTRLAAEIGVERAAQFAEALLLDTLELAQGSTHPVLVAYAPADARAWFEARAPTVARWPQPGGDLGDRMLAAGREAQRRGASRWLIIGMDSPQMPAALFDEALAALEHSDVCIGPARDGGYYLIGMRSPEPELFRDVPWSTPEVLKVTLERCEAAGLAVTVLNAELDVDDGDSLQRLESVLKERPGAAPRTRRLLLG